MDCPNLVNTKDDTLLSAGMVGIHTCALPPVQSTDADIWRIADMLSGEVALLLGIGRI